MPQPTLPPQFWGEHARTPPRIGGLGEIRGQIAALLLTVALLLGGHVGVAQRELSRAGLVIRDQDGELIYATVTFPEEEISGLDLLERSEIPVVTVSFGGLGEAVCAINEVGCSVGDCRQRLCQGPRPDDPFWQYFRQAGSGDWRPQLLGASASTVRDGDIDGWSWTSGEPGLPALTLMEVAELAETSQPRVAGPDSAAMHWPTYIGAGGILLLIGGGAVVFVRWRGTGDAAA